ncbi:ATP-dependent DNA helicase [Trichonephila clavipes]|nr:ATP-dependent DNA helicase [Trichonephila clavipes]
MYDRKNQKIAVAVVNYGIVVTLLTGRRTAHSVLKLQLNLAHEDSPTCNLSTNRSQGRIFGQCNLLVWDENTMSHKKAIEPLNWTLQDLRDSTDIMG